MRWRPRRVEDWSALPVADFHADAVSIDPDVRETSSRYEGPDLAIRPLGVPSRELLPSYSYERPPVDLRGEVGDADAVYRRSDEEHRRGPAVREARFDEALVFDKTVYVVDDGRLVAVHETARSNDRTALNQPTARRLRRVRRLSRRPDTVFLGSPGTANFGHWLVDDLPRAVAMHSTSTTRWMLVQCSTLLDTRRRESLAVALDRPDVDVEFVRAGAPVVVDDLRYASQPSYHPILKAPTAIEMARRRVVAALGALPPGGERLYIARRGGQPGRGLTTLDGIEEVLRRRGFATLDPMTATAREQFAACARADVIVGVMGAAMTNAMFARPGTAVVHLAAGGWVEPFYADLAAVCGHRYTCIYGRAQESGDPWLVPFAVAPNLLEEVLDDLGV